MNRVLADGGIPERFCTLYATNSRVFIFMLPENSQKLIRFLKEQEY